MKKLLHYNILKKGSRVGLLCNQTAWHITTKEYSFESLIRKADLKKIFIPEHGLFGELQDQEKLDITSSYHFFSSQVEWISLYTTNETSLAANAGQLSGIDVLVIDLQDTGSRYYTFITTVWLLLKSNTIHHLDITIIVLDKPNPAGRQVEGTRMTREYASFIGIEGLPHRHGLTIGELCRYFKNKLEADWELIVYPIKKKDYYFVPPSPNIPSARVCSLYSGQCLWEGTNISEGRGTTLPFELIGAPFLDWIFREKWNDPVHPVYNKHVYTRPLIFIPYFHKHVKEACNGLHIMLNNKKKYHSLSHSIKLLKYIKEKTPEFAWRGGKYEALNDKNAIELLAGDQLILDYFENRNSWKELKSKFGEEEAAWIKEATPFLIYKPSLQQLKIN
ncbi:MAG: DUF1343 domain-containing protein [Chitinophagaceae bacterium]